MLLLILQTLPHTPSLPCSAKCVEDSLTTHTASDTHYQVPTALFFDPGNLSFPHIPSLPCSGKCGEGSQNTSTLNFHFHYPLSLHLNFPFLTHYQVPSILLLILLHNTSLSSHSPLLYTEHDEDSHTTGQLLTHT